MKNSITKLFVFQCISILLLSGCVSEKPFLEKYTTESKLISKISNLSIHTLRGFALDKKSNSYAAGNIFGTVELCETTVKGPGHSGLLVKSDSDLNCKWTMEFEARKDRATSFLSGVIVDSKDSILVPGVFNGDLYINDKKYFETNGKFQSFLAKLDVNGKIGWCKEFASVGENFLLTALIKTGKHEYTGIGILNDTWTVIIELDENGKLIRRKDIADGDKIYHCSLVEVGTEIYTSSIGQHFINLRQLSRENNSYKVEWELQQNTGADIHPIKSHLAADIRNGIWIATSFNAGGKDFVFGKDTIKGEDLLDGYVTQFRNRKQVFSAHIKGKGDQIVTGLFDANKSCISLALAHGEFFSMDKLVHQASTSGLSLIEFNWFDPKKVVYATFPLDNKERPRMINAGVYYRIQKGGKEYLGGTFIKGEMQTINPTLTIGKEVLTLKLPVFSSFLIKATPVKKQGPN